VHFFEGLEDVIQRESVDDSWTVYGFEANPIVSQRWPAYSCPVENVLLQNKAVWIREEKLLFRVEDSVGHASTLMDECHLLRDDPSSFEVIEVQGFDLSEFLLKLPKRTEYVVVKMDIEGAEFIVLEHLVRNATHTIMDKLYVEFHDRYMGPEFTKLKEQLLAQLRRDGVEVIIWY
jgi:FkbM family methyltransferase